MGHSWYHATEFAKITIIFTNPTHATSFVAHDRICKNNNYFPESDACHRNRENKYYLVISQRMRRILLHASVLVRMFA